MFILMRCAFFLKLYIINILSFLVFLALRIRNVFFKELKGIRVLVYHSISEVSEKNDPLRITVSPSLFEKQIRYLIGLGYSVISIDELFDYLCGKRNASGKEMVLTFDDGFADNLGFGYNILKKNGLTGTFFLACSYIGSKDTFPWYGKNAPYSRPLNWEEVGIMLNNGMAVGSHTFSHINLGSLVNNEGMLYKEIRDSKEMLEEKLKVNVRYFAYPFGCKGSYNGGTERIVKESGYRAAFTNIFGVNRKNDNPFKLKRTRIDWNDTLFKFRMKIAGAYDWVDSLKL